MSVVEVVWDEQKGPEEYLKLAEEAGKPEQTAGTPYRRGYGEELRRALEWGESRYSALGDRQQWACDLPKVIVLADHNQSGNLVVRWWPAFGLGSALGRGPDQFKAEFLNHKLREAYGNQRPGNELLWIHDFRTGLDSWRPASVADSCLMYAGWAAYLECLRRVSKTVDLVAHRPLIVEADSNGVLGAWFDAYPRPLQWGGP